MIPVPPLTTYPSVLFEKAVPAMSMCAQAASPTNSPMMSAPVIAPAGRPPTFLTSATSLRYCFLYSS